MTTDQRRRQRLALRAAALFDGTRAALQPDPLVLVEDGRIVAVETGRVEPPGDATLVDLGAATLMPGLIDMHVHLALDAGPDPVAAIQERCDATVLEGMAVAARRALRAGITTVRDLGDRNYLALRLRETGAADLPTIVAAGPPITSPGGHCHFLGGTAQGVPAVRALVREHAAQGVDVVKVMASGGFITPGSTGLVPQFGDDELRAVVDEAHRHGLPVTAHAHSTTAIVAALDAGVDGLEHCSFMTDDGVDAPDELIRRIARQRVAVSPTLGALPGATPPPPVARRLEAMRANVGRLHRAGAQVLAASDAGIAPPKPHDVLPHGIEALGRMGLGNYEALRAATVEAARVCGAADRKGRIAPGLDADLIAVDGDPLTDLAALHHVSAVFHNGRRVADAVA